MVRRDPGDIIYVNELYYVWYTKGTIENYNYPKGEGGVASNGLRWGLRMTSYQGGAGLQRFIIQYDGY